MPPVYPQIVAGPGLSTILPDMDFETYSEAGYYWDGPAERWRGITKTMPGLPAVGAAAYSEHSSTEILSLAYDLKKGAGAQLWKPGMPLPTDLFEHLAQGELIEAWNVSFEYFIWSNVCTARMGWPELPVEQLRCAMAKARAWSLPGKLEKAAEVLSAAEQKDPKGNLLIRKLCVPRSPTKRDKRLRCTYPDSPEDFEALYSYCIQDIKAEASVSHMTPDLQPQELDLWLLDQRINYRGMAIDREALDNCIDIVNQAQNKYTAELQQITQGAVQTAGELKKLLQWLNANGLYMPSLDAATIKATLERDDLPEPCRRVLEIRASLGASSVKKLFAIERRLCRDNRLRDLFAFCGADRTGRWAGRGPQPHNLPNSGPLPDWDMQAAEAALETIATRDLATVETIGGDALGVISGCLRGLFCAAPGYELICSDYSAIEAVILAFLAGEEWRMEVFKTHGLIYEASASKITGIPFEDFIRHKKEKGVHHPLRSKLGKVAELASGYQGSVGAWKQFGASEFLSDEEILANVQAWRKASPAIVSFWYKVEEAVITAIQNPGKAAYYQGLTFGVKDDVLYCRLLSGRLLSYHSPRLHPDTTPYGRSVLRITYMGWNSDYMKGPVGWMRMDTYGGKLTENIVQATARDVLAYGMLNLDRAGYDIVLHVHDEIVAEVATGGGSIEEFERIMGTMPVWCSEWPIKAAGGWRGKRYRKE